jgi:hypothetical protein
LADGDFPGLQSGYHSGPGTAGFPATSEKQESEQAHHYSFKIEKIFINVLRSTGNIKLPF